MDFKEGGFWLYCMVGPEDYKAWCIENFKSIELLKRITSTDSFCDEQGNQSPDSPVMNWRKEFNETGNGTTVNIEIVFDKEADMEAIIKMGFQEGFTAGLDNLDDYLSTQ
jgi:PhnB protein